MPDVLRSSRPRIDEMCSYRAALELGALRITLAGGNNDFAEVAESVEFLESLPDSTPWRTVIGAHAAIHHQIVVASGNQRLIKAHRDCEAELTFMFSTIKAEYSAQRLAVVHRYLLEQLRVGGEAAIRALEEDLELGGRSALHLALRRHRQSESFRTVERSVAR